MNLDFLFLPVAALVVGGIAFIYAWFESRAYDRRWNRHPDEGK